MTTGSAGQAGVEALFAVQPGGDVHQGGVEALFTVLPGTDVGQAGVEYLLRVQPVQGVTQAGVEVLYKNVPCTTKWCQVWIITRRDGTVFRFTSLDRRLTWRGEVYKACDSLTPSASESSDEVGGVGSMDLAGILSDSSISQADLYAGRFDDARIEAWSIPWEGQGETPERLLAGTFGKVAFGENGFKVELVGDGARMQQTSLTSIYAPGCRWLFGSAPCGKDLGPLTVTGVVEVGGARTFVDTGRAEAEGYFSRGVVTFTSGANAGVAAEIRDHFAGGEFTLWPRLVAPIAAGDAYSMTPGCTLNKDDDGGTKGCRGWANVINFGGFPDVPGPDALSETPDAK